MKVVISTEAKDCDQNNYCLVLRVRFWESARHTKCSLFKRSKSLAVKRKKKEMTDVEKVFRSVIHYGTKGIDTGVDLCA